LKSGHVGAAGLDVYESEQGYFFEDKSGTPLGDDVLARLLTFSNVAVTSHQAFLTKEALANIAQTTIFNIGEYEAGKRMKELKNTVNP
jgi:D-lactate dehydrogenase